MSRRITRAPVDRTGNRYCGPLVLAALIGCTTAEAAAKVRSATGDHSAIKGMHNHELIKTLKAAGHTLLELPVAMRMVEARNPGEPSGQIHYGTDSWSINVPGGVRLWRPADHSQGASAMCLLRRQGPTLAAWLRTRPDKCATYIINVTGHYVLVSGRKFVDTYTKGEWVNIGKAPHRRCRVVKVWQVT